MGTQTPNHSFDKPTPGGDTDNWGTLLNQTIDSLEQEVVIVDTAANRSNYTAYEDAAFIASDTGQISTGDGTNWNELPLQLHSSSHEPGGADEINDIDISGSGTNLSSHAIRHESGGADELSVDSIAQPDDDEKVYFGTGDDWSVRYDSSIPGWVLRDETVPEDVATYGDAGSAVEMARSLGTSTTPIPGTSHFNDIIVGGNDGVGVPDTTTSISPGLDTWTTANSSRPTLLYAYLRAETDGTTRGMITIEVDESGGTTADYELGGAYADPALPSGTRARESSCIMLPAGAQFQIRNIDDPNAGNLIITSRIMVL